MKEALKLALEALEAGDWYIGQLEMIVYSSDDTGTHENRAKVQEVITSIKETLAQPEQEPVACDCRLQADECNGDTATFHPFQVGASCSTRLCERVYTTPPKRPWGKPWVSLTDEEIEEAYAKPTLRKMYQAIEAKLKEKNT